MQEYYRGQYDTSERTEKRAKKWAIASIVTGVVLVVFFVTLAFVVQIISYTLIGTSHRD